MFTAGMRLASHCRMTQINSFRDLTIWQVNMDLADVCFDIVEAIPHPYRFTFTNQVIRKNGARPRRVTGNA